MVADLSCEMLEKNEEIQEKDKVIKDVQNKFEASLKEKLCAQKLKWYYKTKAVVKLDEDVEISSKFYFVKEKIGELENEKMILQEKLGLTNEDTCLFENGKYGDTIRMLF